jgi:hypothetical protein
VLIDMRTYTVRPGTLKLALELYEKHGMPAQTRHLGKPFAYMTCETGDPNTYVHMWAYEDAADRARRRAAMLADPEWQAYLKMNAEAGYLIKQQNWHMVPTSFAPIQKPA